MQLRIGFRYGSSSGVSRLVLGPWHTFTGATASRVVLVAARLRGISASLFALGLGRGADLDQGGSEQLRVLSKHNSNVALVHNDFGPDFEQQDPPTKSWLRLFDESVAVADLKKYGFT